MPEIYPDAALAILRKIARGEVTVDYWTNGNFFSGFSYPTIHTTIADITVFIDVDQVDFVDSMTTPNGDHYDHDTSKSHPLRLLSNSDRALLDWRLAEASQPRSDYEKSLTAALRKHVVLWGLHGSLRSIGLKPVRGISYMNMAAVSWSDDVKTMKIVFDIKQDDTEFPSCQHQ